jgi:MraZ protein
LALFRGTFDHTLDAKNRLTMPARYRDLFKEGVVLAMPIDQLPCVGVWRPSDYEDYSRGALASKPALSGQRAELERFFYGNSKDVELDKAGRVIIPAFLSEHAKLQKDILVVGAGDRLELWSRELWQGHQTTLHDSVANIIASVDDAS